MTATAQLILASSSQYRMALLQKLGLTFSCHAANINESARKNESAATLALRLSIEKAQAIAAQNNINNTDSWIIGSDQVASLNGQRLGKPGNHQQARAQLKIQSGQTVSFHTGLCLYHARSGKLLRTVDSTKVHFKHLNDEQIEGYLLKDQPYDCAGSFKSEGLGIALFQRIESNDPNSLIGLPLLILSEWLKEIGMDPLLCINTHS